MCVCVSGRSLIILKTDSENFGMKCFMINRLIFLTDYLSAWECLSVKSLLLFVKQEVVFKWADTAVCFLIGLIFNKVVEIKLFF